MGNRRVALWMAIGGGAFVVLALLYPGHDNDPSIHTLTTPVILSKNGAIRPALDTFRLEIGRYPTTLQELADRPADPGDAAKWRGPYVKDSATLHDSWGRELNYRLIKDGAQYQLWSSGRDGKSGTDDDVWPDDSRASRPR